MPQRGEEGDDDSGVVAHVGQHAGAPAASSRLGRRCPAKKGPMISTTAIVAARYLV